MTDTIRRQIGYCLTVILAALTCAVVIAVFMRVAPGLLPVFGFAVFWWAVDMPVYDIDAELAKLLSGV